MFSGGSNKEENLSNNILFNEECLLKEDIDIFKKEFFMNEIVWFLGVEMRRKEKYEVLNQYYNDDKIVFRNHTFTKEEISMLSNQEMYEKYMQEKSPEIEKLKSRFIN